MLVEGVIGGGQVDLVVVLFQQCQVELVFQLGNGGEYCWMGVVQVLCGGLEVVGVDYCVEVLEVVEGEVVYVSFIDRVVLFFVVFFRGCCNQFGVYGNYFDFGGFYG